MSSTETFDIVDLIKDYIIREGVEDPSGQKVVRFGDLRQDNQLEPIGALPRYLKMAKRNKIIHFESENLQKGVHDRMMIKLLSKGPYRASMDFSLDTRRESADEEIGRMSNRSSGDRMSKGTDHGFVKTDFRSPEGLQAEQSGCSPESMPEQHNERMPELYNERMSIQHNERTVDHPQDVLSKFDRSSPDRTSDAQDRMYGSRTGHTTSDRVSMTRDSPSEDRMPINTIIAASPRPVSPLPSQALPTISSPEPVMQHEPEPVTQDEPERRSEQDSVLSSSDLNRSSDKNLWTVDTDYVRHRTASPNRMPGRIDCRANSGSPAPAMSSKDENGKWVVNTGYVDHRTTSPNRTSARQGSQVLTVASVCDSSQKDESGNWKVSTAYVHHRTASPNRTNGRDGVVDGAPVVEASKRDSSGNWKVDTDYVQHRTASPDRLVQRQKENVQNLESSRRDSRGNWKVETDYVKHRTISPGRVVQREQAAEVIQSSQKDDDGRWVVDTSYVKHRTEVPDHLRTSQFSKKLSEFNDPLDKKYDLDELVGKCPDGVDPSKKELYLEDFQFEAVFNMSSDAFQKMPKWKQQNIKKSANLF